jgi:hypothetical protein
MINPIGAECLIDIGLGDLETVRAMQFFIADDHGSSSPTIMS